MSDIKSSPSFFQSYDQRKIGTSIVSNDERGKIGSVRGNHYSTLDNFGTVGLAAPMVEVKKQKTNDVELVVEDVTIKVDHEHPVKKGSTHQKISKSFGQQFLEKQAEKARAIDRITRANTSTSGVQGERLIKENLQTIRERERRNAQLAEALDDNSEASGISSEPAPESTFQVEQDTQGSREGIPDVDDFTRLIRAGVPLRPTETIEREGITYVDDFTRLIRAGVSLRPTETIERRLFPPGQIVPAQPFLGVPGFTAQFRVRSAVDNDFALPTNSKNDVFANQFSQADDALNNQNISIQSRTSSGNDVNKAKALGPSGLSVRKAKRERNIKLIIDKEIINDTTTTSEVPVRQLLRERINKLRREQENINANINVSRTTSEVPIRRSKRERSKLRREHENIL